jgi:transcriptional regulator with XRE-family HTH domain
MIDNTIKKIGERIREIRRRNNLTLKTLSEKTGISISMISKIETAKTSPPISTYANIACGLGITLGDLILNDLQESDLSVVRSDERPIISRGTYIGSPLAFKKSKKKMEPFIFEYPIMKESHDFFQHDSEEMIFVIKGTIKFKYGKKTIILKKGDCAYFNGKIPHGGRALNNRKAIAIIIQSNL